MHGCHHAMLLWIIYCVEACGCQGRQDNFATMAVLVMWKWMSTITVGLLLIHISTGVQIPEEVELIDGFPTDPLTYDLTEPRVEYYEKPSLVEEYARDAVRDKRSTTRYQVLESAGLHSHFRRSEANDQRASKHSSNRSKRNAEPEPDGVTDASTDDGPEAREEIPVPEKHVMSAQDRTKEGQWSRTPFKSSEFQAKVMREESDSDGEESMLINEGIKSRAPRVNFITQQTKGGLSATESRDDDGNEKVIRELYRKPVANLQYERPVPRTYDSYMAPSQSPMYPRVYNKYDAFHRDMMDRMHPPAPHRYDHYYQRRYDVDYDPYFPRYKFPYYYYYPDKRYDVPLYYRDRNSLYTNDIEATVPIAPPYYGGSFHSGLYPPSVSPALRNRRIIYFATLPEIVRPPSVQRYGPGGRYDAYYTTRTPPLASAYKDPRPVKNDRKDDKHVSSKPIKIVREAETEQDRISALRSSLGTAGKGQQQQQQRRWDNSRETKRAQFRDTYPFLEPERSYYGR
uniref:Uncharacterized protein n=1 Tax=Anopheles farauti TaxID=69004 RepID=A0A182QKZ9_9DIPT